MNAIASALASFFEALKNAARIFVSYWPSLFAIFFVGSALHGGFLWLAVWMSDFAPILGMVFLPLSSISLLVAIILMLRLVAPSLPALRESLIDGSVKVRLRSDLSLAVMVLIPFLAVYASEGMLKQDLRTFFHNVTADEWMTQGFNADFSRAVFASDTQMIILVIIALVLRKVIAGFDLGKRNLAVASFAGYLEALWLLTLASYLAWSLESVREWVMGRAVIQAGLGHFRSVIEFLGPLGHAVEAVLNQIGSILSSMGVLVIVPVAWVAVGATIYGSTLPSSKPMLTSEQVTKRFQKIPNPVRRAAAQVVEPVVSPVQNTTRAIGKIAVAGVVPMVLLCLVFAGASQLRVLFTEAMRLAIGPRPTGFWVGFDPYILMFSQAAYTVVMVCLLAASVNTIILRQRAAAEKAVNEQGLEQSMKASAPQTL